MDGLRTGGIAATVISSTGGAMGACDVMRGRGWCHKCVALGCHGPAQTPVNGRAARMRVRPTTAAPLRLPAGGWGSSMDAVAALRGVSRARSKHNNDDEPKACACLRSPSIDERLEPTQRGVSGTVHRHAGLFQMI